MKNVQITERIYKVLGWSEDVNECQCCGRQDLKGTVVLQDDSGNIGYFGIVCGSRMAGYTKKYTEEQLDAVELENVKKAQEEFKNSPEKIAFDQYMIDREKMAGWKGAWAERHPMIKESFRLGALADAVKQQLVVKYRLGKKIAYRVGIV